MKILKYKKLSNGQYKLTLENCQEVQLYEETILKYEFLLHGIIDNIDEAREYDKQWNIYYVALKILKARFKSSKDLRDTLLKKEYPADLVDATIDKLLQQGYLNDASFAKSYINNQIVTSSRGPLRITKDLLSKGISSDIINNEISIFTEDVQIEKINKVISVSLKSNKTRGGGVLKNKIVNDLVGLGYELSVINKVIKDYKFDNDEIIAKREYEKLYRKYSRKYSGKELEYKIKEKLYQKGLTYED